MADPRDEDVERLRRSVRLLAEVVDDVIDTIQTHMHQADGSLGEDFRSDLNAALGKLDAVQSALGVGERGGGRGEGGADGD